MSLTTCYTLLNIINDNQQMIIKYAGIYLPNKFLIFVGVLLYVELLVLLWFVFSYSVLVNIHNYKIIVKDLIDRFYFFNR